MAGVQGSRDGLVATNDRSQKVTSLITVSELKSQYLTGLDITIPATNKPLPNKTYQTYIDNAVSMVEHYLDISITKVENFVENKDYRLNDYVMWGYFQLNNYPTIRINTMKLTYFRDEFGVPSVVQTIPLNWIRLQPHDGIVRLIPNARFPSNLQVSQSGNYFPEILRSQFVPHLWELNYDYGFEDGKVPTFLNSVIAKVAAMQALIVGGNLVLGAGIAASSISLDGLSQSIETTQSAENSAFSATIKEYAGQVFGRSKEDRFAELTVLKNYYDGSQMNIV